MHFLEIIPPFDWHTVVVAPWTEYFVDTLIIWLMGALVASACGLVGVFLLLRQMALMGDAISHSLLPGIVLAFLITASRGSGAMFIGAICAGLLTVLLIEAIHRHSRIKPDAAMGIIFSTLFAIGIIMVTTWADHVDLDADCVLYGELGLVIFGEPVSLASIPLGPLPLVRMAAVTLGLVCLILLFYKELLVTSFDSGLAQALGLRPGWYHYGLMVVMSVVLVSAFESVGAILVIAMLIFPGATALLLFDRLPHVLLASVGLAFLASLLGIHLAEWLNSSIAGAITTAASFCFLFVWCFSPRRGLLLRVLKRSPQQTPAPSRH